MPTYRFIRDLLDAHLSPRLHPSPRLAALADDDRGEGVISAAIAVLIMAFLGAAMWIGFHRMWETTERTTQDKVEEIGR